MAKKRNVIDEDELVPEFDPIDTEITPGIYMLSGAVVSENITPLIASIIAENITGEQESITLIINSEGGSLPDAFALVSVMRTSLIPITTIAIGECASAALMIFMAGDLRLVDENASCLSHQFSAAFPGHTKAVDLRARQKDLELTEVKIEDHYVRYTGLTREEVNEKLLTSSDIFLTAEQLIKYNIADGLFTSMNQFLPKQPETII